MSGFALIFDLKESLSAHDPGWIEYLDRVAEYKHMDKSDNLASGTHCLAAKLDAPCSLHRGITHDAKTGAWLLAIGTVIDPVDNRPDGSLDRLLADYLETGTQVFARLDGQFALVIYDAREDSLLVVSDPFGLIAVYFGLANNRIYVSTSALATAQVIRSAPSELRVRSFLLYGDTLGGTLWEDVQLLPAATVLKITRNGVRESTYWSFAVDEGIARLSLDESVDCIIESLSLTMRQCLLREGKVWVSFTGGLDSRTLAAIMQHSQLPFKTYCHGPIDSRDVRIAERISQEMGWEYEYFALPDDWGVQRAAWLERAVGQTDGHLGALKLSRTIREQTLKGLQLPVSIWGYGGEVYRGYYWKQEFWKTGKTSDVDYNRWMDYRVTQLDESILRDGERWKSVLREEHKNWFRAVGERHHEWLNTIKLDLIGQSLERHAYCQTITAVLGQQRVILPYDFKDNIVRILSVNYQWRTHSRLFRLILERINPKLARMEMADGGPAAPMRLTNIHRFVPYWLDTSEKLFWKLSHKYLGRALWHKRNAGPQGKAYPVAQWLQDTTAQLKDHAILNPTNMHSAKLYNLERLQSLLDGQLGGDTANETLLSHIIAVELALRLVDASM